MESDPPIWILCYAPVGMKVSSLLIDSSPGKYKTRTGKRKKKAKKPKVGSRFNTLYCTMYTRTMSVGVEFPGF